MFEHNTYNNRCGQYFFGRGCKLILFTMSRNLIWLADCKMHTPLSEITKFIPCNTAFLATSVVRMCMCKQVSNDTIKHKQFHSPHIEIEMETDI